MNKIFWLVSFLIFSFFQTPLVAKITLSKLFSDNMVMQRNQKIKVWGWADENEKIVLTFNKQTHRATPDTNGKWSIILTEMEAGGPFQMIVAGMENKIVVSNILIGDVWICSGQSNMEWQVSQSKNPSKEIKSAIDSKIRHIKIPHAYSESKVDTILNTNWTECSPKTAGDYTAVGYFFARELRKHHDVPIDLLNVSWGGSKIQAWMDAKSLGLKSSPFADSQLKNTLMKKK